MEIIKYVTDNHVKLSISDIDDLFLNKEDNKELIIKTQLALAYNISKSFCLTTSYTLEDAFSVAMEGLLIAFNLYKPEGKSTFTSYARISIEHRLIDQVKYENGIKQPKNKENVAKTYNISSFGYDSDETTDFFERYVDDYDEDENTYKNITSDDLIDYLIDNMSNLFTNKKCEDTFYEKIYVLKYYFGIGCERKKGQEIANDLGISKQRVGQIKKRMIEELKKDENFKELLLNWNF